MKVCHTGFVTDFGANFFFKTIYPMTENRSHETLRAEIILKIFKIAFMF